MLDVPTLRQLLGGATSLWRRPPRNRAPSPTPARWRRPDLWICLALLAATYAACAPVRHFDLVDFDDPECVRDNPHVRAGLTPQSMAWAVASTDSANWFPVTRLSHPLDAQFFGMRAGPQHFPSVLIHALAALCLFAFLRRAAPAGPARSWRSCSPCIQPTWNRWRE